MPLKDLTRQKFGRLTVIKRADSGPKYRTRWLCRCDCGKEKVILSTSLISGYSKSCGCLRTDFFENSKIGYGESAINKLIREYKRRARKRNQEFLLTKEQFIEITSKDCFYCCTKPKQLCKSGNKNGDYFYNGIDRIDSEKDYIYDNCVPCCLQCNRSKSNMKTNEFIDWITTVYNRRTEILCQQIF